MAPSKRVAILTAVLLSTICSSNAQQPDNCTSRNVVVDALDREGNLVSNLKTTDFRATVHGVTVHILDGTPTKGPQRVVILLDISGSMANSLSAGRALAGNLVATQTGTLQPALVLFSDHVLTTSDFSHPPGDVLHILENLPGGKGRTALLDALKHAANIFGEPHIGDAAYVISDGGDNASRVQVGEVEQEFLSKGIRIFFFTFRYRYYPTQEERQAPDLLDDLAHTTGGQALQIDSEDWQKTQEQVSSEVRKLYKQMSNFYTLQLELPAINKWESLKLELLDEKGRKRKEVRLFYPHRLAPCKRFAFESN